MTPAAKQLYDFILADLEANAGSTTFADDLLSSAKAKITAGGGMLGFLNTSSLNGKSFGQTLVCTALDVASACRAALDDYDDDGVVQITHPDFANTFIQS